MWYAIGAVVLAVIVFLIWRITSVGRGVRQRDERIMEALRPIGEKLVSGEEITADEVRAFCLRHELRPQLYNTLKYFEKLEFFPAEYSTWESQAEGILAEWMMHPNELQAPPATMECLKRVDREIGDLQATFIVLAYAMPAGHWAGDDHLMGLSGPFVETEVPYSGLASAFSRCGDKKGTLEPEELVDWFVNMCTRKSG